MKQIIRKIILIILVVCVQTTNAQKWIGFKLDKTQLITQKDSFNIVNLAHQKIGSMVLETKLDDSKYIMSDISILDGMVKEESKYIFNRKSLSLEEFNMKFEQGQMVVNSNLTWNGKYAKGKYEMKRGTASKKIEVDTTFNSKLIDRGEVFAFIQALPLKVGLKANFPVLAQPNYEVWDMTLEIVSETVCKVPAGEFETYKIDFLGDKVSNTIYVTKNSPHRIVKVDVIGQLMEIVLVSNK